MRDFLKNKLVTVIIVVATVILAGIAIFTAIRLYQLRQESISPARPESAPEASEPTYESCNVFTFRLGETPPPEVTICDVKEAYRNNPENAPGNYSASYTEDQLIGSGGIVTPGEIIVYRIVPSPTITDEPFVITDTLSEKVEFLDADNKCNYNDTTRTVTCEDISSRAYRVTVKSNTRGTIENSASINGAISPAACQLTLNIESEGTPSPTPSATPTPSPTPTDTASPSPTPTGTATATPSPSPTGTSSPGPTTTASATPSPSAVAQATPTAQPELPEAGIGAPTIIGLSAAVILLLISFIFAL